MPLSLNLADLESATTIALNVAGVLGVIVGVPLFFWQRFQEKRQRDQAVYTTLQDAYDHFMDVVLASNDLDIYGDLPDRKALGPLERRRRLVVFSILVNLMERAFVLYADCSTDAKRRHWEMWEDYIEGWCARASFIEDFEHIVSVDDTDFMVYMRELKSRVCSGELRPGKRTSELGLAATVMKRRKVGRSGRKKAATQVGAPTKEVGNSANRNSSSAPSR